MIKLDINAQNFRHRGSNSIEVIFSDSFHLNLSNDMFGSEEVRIFPLFFIVFGNDTIMRSFLVTWFSNLHIL